MQHDKKILNIVSGLAVLVSVAITPVSVFAAQTVDGKATLTVVAPSTDTLDLVTTPNIDFGTTTIADRTNIINGITDTPYTIVDLRGGNTGYRVQVEASNFILKSDGQTILPVTAVAMNVSNNASGTLKGSGSDTNIFGQQAVVLTGNADSNGTQISGKVTASLTFDQEKLQSLKVGEYQATLTHSIVSGIQ